MTQPDTGTVPAPPIGARDLYEITLKPGLHYDRPCGCNQGTGQGESCVLIGVDDTSGLVSIKDSKNVMRPDLRFEPGEFAEFLRSPGVAAFLAANPAA